MNQAEHEKTLAMVERCALHQNEALLLPYVRENTQTAENTDWHVEVPVIP